MRIGLFFGTFNPVHAGHMIIAGYFAEFSDLDQVWMVVTPHNPHKQAGSLLQDHHRFEMVRIAIGDYNKIKASKVEFSLPKPSFTIHTLLHLEEQYPDHEFNLIMGSDNLAGFMKWKSWEQIIERHKLYVYPRPGSDGGEMKDHEKVVFVDAPHIELSSTFIRDAVKNKKDIRYMMPESAYEYMDEMNFYRK
jgi:nicotinate-nucleotide adenylyltransferase